MGAYKVVTYLLFTISSLTIPKERFDIIVPVAMKEFIPWRFRDMSQFDNEQNYWLDPSFPSDLSILVQYFT